MHLQARKVVIVDYGMGNIRSLSAAVEHIGYNPVVSDKPGDIVSAETLVLPGVGSFPYAMRIIDSLGLRDALRDVVSSRKCKLLGICLGMQLLMDSSDEGEGAIGLQLIRGDVERFQSAPNLPVPHIGFSSVDPPRGSVLFEGLGESTDFYFVHSYRAVSGSSEDLLAYSHYGEDFVAAIESGNVYGTQFHPEKSQTNGLQLLSNFLAAEIR